MKQLDLKLDEERVPDEPVQQPLLDRLRGGGGSGSERSPAIVICRGARCALEALLHDLGALHRKTLAQRPLRPLLVVVPSNALRVQLVGDIVRALGPAVVGIEVRTLWAVALSIAARIGAPPAAAPWAAGVCARRAVRAHPLLDERLAGFEDGAGLAGSTFSDLLSAGLESEAQRAQLQRVAGERDPGQGAWVDALASGALDVRRRLERAGLLRAGDVLAAAARAIREDPSKLQVRGIAIHGFADAAGQGVALLRALVERGARLYVDRPARPLDPTAEDRGAAFSDPFIAALGGEGRAPERRGRADGRGPVRVELFDAAGTEREVSEAAMRVGALLAEGIEPERIAVIARDLDPYLLEIRRTLSRRGIPFSGPAAPPGLSPARRRWDAALALLGRAEAALVEHWLDALCPDLLAIDQRDDDGDRLGASNAGQGRVTGASGAVGDGDLDRTGSVARQAVQDLRLALRAMGRARLGDAAGVEPGTIPAAGMPLPLRSGLQRMPAADGDADRGGDSMDDHGDARAGDFEPDLLAPGGSEARAGQPGARVGRRRVARRIVLRALELARALLDELAAWPDRAPLEEHAACTRRFLADGLGWGRFAPEDGRVPVGWRQRLSELSLGWPGDQELSREEYLHLLAEATAELEAVPSGGRGGGVQLLDAMHARGMVFEAIVLVGLNRDQFPRSPVRDPLLPDDLRRQLRLVLPHLPLKAQGHAEERYLFAQLIGAAERVTLSWQRCDEQGRPRAVSPLVQRMIATAHDLPIYRVPRARELLLRPPNAGGKDRPRDRHELLVAAALAGDRGRFAQQLVGALGGVLEQLERPTDSGSVEPADGSSARSWRALAGPRSLAEARLEVLRQQEPRSWSPGAGVSGYGPYLGAVGPSPPGAADPRDGAIAVTTLEELARCPWRAFLRVVLRVEPPPDSLGELPAISRLMIGNCVHELLQQLVGGSAQADRDGTVHRPDPRRVSTAAAEVARRVARAEGLQLSGLQRALAAMALPLAERALAIDWPHPNAGRAVLGAEVERSVSLDDGSGRRRQLRFTADRVDRAGDQLVFTDYKTGGPISRGTRAKTRLRHLRRAIRRGERLQIALYALSDENAGGRYLFLSPDLSLLHAVAQVDGEDPVVRRDLPRVVARLLQLWDLGVFFPRLEDADGREPRLCSYCDVAEACVRGDSSARARLHDLAAGLRELPDEQLDPQLAALKRGWWIADDADEDAEGGAGER